jgi:hypothetical protein
MADKPKLTLEDKVRALRERYAGSVEDKLAEINALYEKLLAKTGGGGLLTAIDSLIAPVRKMAGSAPTFGLADLGGAALELEVFLVASKDNSDVFSDAQGSKLLDLMETLRQVGKAS